jgi:glycosyltransferase involved in cell wall biosynthesis
MVRKLLALTQKRRTSKDDAKMKEPLVSIIITSYNYGRFLAGAVESAIKQTYENTEVIAINDGSTDDTEDVAKRYPVQYIFQKNQGVAIARNNGIKRSRGEFFICLDADDKLFPQFVAKTAERMMKDPKIGFVCAGDRVWNEDTKIENLWIPHKIHSKYGIFAGWIGALGSVLIRRTAFDSLECGFDASLPVFEDLDLCFRLLLKGWKIEVMSEPLVLGRLHRGSRNTASIRTKKSVETFMYRKYRYIRPYQRLYMFYQSTLGRATALMFHPFAYLEGIKEKVKVRTWVESCHWVNSVNLEDAKEDAREISLTVDKQIEWSWNKELGYYYARRRRILESRLMRILSREETNM